MSKQDRSGVKYENFIKKLLHYLGYKSESNVGKNYLNPNKRSKSIAIPGTYTQPDFVIRQDTNITAILYVTHWSKKRNSSFKFWRTWEESAQQKIIIGNGLLTVNCLFEALPERASPDIFITSDELPKDNYRDDVQVPIGFSGWYPALSWAVVEAFDVSLVFPLHYNSVHELNFDLGEHDFITSQLLEKCLQKKSKTYLEEQWNILRKIHKEVIISNLKNQDTHTRYRIGLLHVYLAYQLFIRKVNQCNFYIEDFICLLIQVEKEHLKCQQKYFKINSNNTDSKLIEVQKLCLFFEQIGQVYTRSGEKATTLCTVHKFSDPSQSSTIYKIKFNKDLSLCLQDIKAHLKVDGFIKAIEQAFIRFDKSYGIDEALENLSHPEQVCTKENFVRQYFLPVINDEKELNEMLQTHAKCMSPERASVSGHQQNWVFEMLIYLANVNIAEDIYTQIAAEFENLGHKLRPHAPFKDETMMVSYLLRGRDICEHWTSRNQQRTLSEEQFKYLCWQAIAKCIVKSLSSKKNYIQDSQTIISKFLFNRTSRIISSELNSLHIIIEYFLGDLCQLFFTDDEKLKKNQKISYSVHTEITDGLWGNKSLETYMEGISNNGQWLIKIQSSQDGHQSDKTKELAGRCRAIHIAWSHGSDPLNRLEWSFTKRQLPKLALLLDGDWTATQKRNLYEAGWDWVGDVAELGELRNLIQEESE